MNPFRSVGARLALALLLVVAGALAIVYLIVVPSYRQSIVGARLDSLETSVQTILERPWQADYLIQQWAQDQAPKANARVVVFSSYGTALSVYADSNTVTEDDLHDDLVALRAARGFRPARGTVTRGGREFA